MELTLFEEDLELQYQDQNTSQLKFYMFKPEVREAITIVGRALFRRRQTHQAIYHSDKPLGLCKKCFKKATRENINGYCLRGGLKCRDCGEETMTTVEF